MNLDSCRIQLKKRYSERKKSQKEKKLQPITVMRTNAQITFIRLAKPETSEAGPLEQSICQHRGYIQPKSRPSKRYAVRTCVVCSTKLGKRGTSRFTFRFIYCLIFLCVLFSFLFSSSLLYFQYFFYLQSFRFVLFVSNETLDKEKKNTVFHFLKISSSLNTDLSNPPIHSYIHR